jgi:hypothetical protein
MVGGVRLAIATLVLALVGVGCGSFFPTPLGTPAFDAEIHVDNGTDLAVTIVVNGAGVGGAPAHLYTTIPAAALPPKPWVVEARSASGRVLVTFTVQPGQVTSTTSADGVASMTGAGSRADLSCGRLDVTVGPPMLGPAPGPIAGHPGDCDP